MSCTLRGSGHRLQVEHPNALLPAGEGKGQPDDVADQEQWWAQQDSNLQPKDYESSALTIEL